MLSLRFQEHYKTQYEQALTSVNANLVVKVLYIPVVSKLTQCNVPEEMIFIQ